MRTSQNYYCSEQVCYNSVVKHILGCGMVKLNDEGHIDIVFNSYNYSKGDSANETINFYVSIIKKRPGKNIKVNAFDEYFFKEQLKFDPKDLKEFYDETSKRIREQEELLNIEQTKQMSLPEKL